MAVTLFEKKENCSGCGACMNACVQNAIFMEADEFGFQYPKINIQRCIECGACTKACGYQNVPRKNSAAACYGATANDDALLHRSASGGVFAALARAVLSQGGAVYGAAMLREQDVFVPKHIRVESEQKLYLLQGSKYVQSDTGITYSQTKEDLKSGKPVLYSGTPCQIAGLLTYLGKDYDNLLTAEVVCHGVPSAKFFRDFISVLENKLEGKILDFAFRSKEKNRTKLVNMQIFKENRISRQIRAGHELSYMHYFAQGAISRDSCYQCPFATIQRVADITLGDFWGFHEEYPKEGRMVDSKGISCVLVNTDRGKQSIEALKTQFTMLPVQPERIARHNAQLNTPCQYPKQRDVLLELYRHGGYRAVEEHFAKNCKKERWRNTLKECVPPVIKRQLKRMKGQIKASMQRD